MSNLVILCGGTPGTVVAELPEIVRLHPARVVMLGTADAHQADDIEAYVSAQCYVASGGRQVCSEHIMVRARAAAAGRLPSVVRPLLIGDLPTALWWAVESAAADGPLLDELTPVAEQLIYDSAGWDDGVSSLAPLFQRAIDRSDRLAVADLAWHRLHPWRLLLSEVLDPATAPGVLRSITDVHIEHGSPGLAPALLLAGWLASRLGWRPETAASTADGGTAWTLHAPQGAVRITVHGALDRDADLHGVVIDSTAPGAPTRIRVTMPAAGRLEASTDDAGASRRSTFPVRDRAALVALQLTDLGRSPVFLDALTAARQLVWGVAGKA